MLRTLSALLGTFTLSLLLMTPAWAAIDTFEFADPANRERFQTLAEELRCPKCQNQNLSDSNSPIAADMRREIHRMLEDGQSEDQVVDFMVARYGDFVRYRPKNDDSTWLLWYGPIILIGCGALAVVLISSRRKAASTATEQKLTDQDKLNNDQDKLNKLLSDYDDDNKA